MKLLGVLLCYNDGDFLEDSIRYLLEQSHDLVVWNHGSTDETGDILRQYKSQLLEYRYVPREFDFYDIYPAMSRNLIENHASLYDWISWPDQDEILEGPFRSKTYREWIEEVHTSSCNWIQSNNYNYWFTSSDDMAIKSPAARIRHYSIFPEVGICFTQVAPTDCGFVLALFRGEESDAGERVRLLRLAARGERRASAAI